MKILLLSLLLQPDDLAKLQTENAKLKDDVTKLHAEIIRLQREKDLLTDRLLVKADEITRLKQMIKDLERKLLEKNTKENPNNIKDIPGPEKPIVGEVLSVNSTWGFIIIDAGEKEGVEKGFKFEILRNDKKIAVAEVEELVGEKKDKTKLKIVEGSWGDVKVKDKAVAMRKVSKLPDKPPKQTKFKITGVAGDSFTINGGWEDLLKEGDSVYIFRNDKVLARGKLTKVDRLDSEAKLNSEDKSAKIKVDDDAEIRRGVLDDKLVGKVLHVSTDRGVMVDIGTLNKARPGQKYVVRRDGKEVAKIVLKDVQQVFSYGSPLEGYTLDDVKDNDIVQLYED